MENPDLLFVIAAVAATTALEPSARGQNNFYAEGLYTGPSTTVAGITFESGVTTYTEFFTLNSIGGGAYAGTAYEKITTGSSSFTTPTVNINSVNYGTTSTFGVYPYDGVSSLSIDAGSSLLDFGFSLYIPDAVSNISLTSLSPFHNRLDGFIGAYDPSSPYAGSQIFAFAGDPGSTPSAFGLTPVPEPSTIALGAVCLTASMTARRLRRNTSTLA